jgi:predicted transcriptional regulator
MRRLILDLLDPRHITFWRLVFVVALGFVAFASIAGLWNYLQVASYQRAINASALETVRRINERIDKQTRELSLVQEQAERSRQNRLAIEEKQVQTRQEVERLRQTIDQLKSKVQSGVDKHE